MNQAVFAFRRYEDASLRYTGGRLNQRKNLGGGQLAEITQRRGCRKPKWFGKSVKSGAIVSTLASSSVTTMHGGKLLRRLTPTPRG